MKTQDTGNPPDGAVVLAADDLRVLDKFEDLLAGLGLFDTGRAAFLIMLNLDHATRMIILNAVVQADPLEVAPDWPYVDPAAAMDTARDWARAAGLTELKALLCAAFERLSPRDKCRAIAFLLTKATCPEGAA